MNNKNNLVVKSNLLINAKGKYKYSKNELKLICSLIANIKKEDKEINQKTINLKDLGFTTDEFNNHTYLNELCNDLLSKPFRIPNTKKWVNWFSMLEPIEGVINYKFVEDLRPYLLELKEQFTSYYLENVLKLKSSYSINIYELLKQLEGIGFRKFEIEEFKELLAIPDSYKFSNLKNLLEKVKQDLEENTDIKFTYSLEKQGRKFQHINFKILKNKDNENDIKNFIKSVRKNYVNQAIFTPIGIRKKSYIMSVNQEGKLYALDDRNLILDAEESQKIWDYFYQNKHKLLPYTSSLF